MSLPLDQAPQADLIDDATRTAGGRMVVDVTNGRKGMGTFIESHRQYFFTCARFASQFAQASLERACNDLLLRINLSTLDACILEFVASEVLAGGMPFRQMMQLRAIGRIKYAGLRLSNISQYLWALKNTAVHILMVDYPLLQSPAADEMLQLAAEGGVGVIVRYEGGDTLIDRQNINQALEHPAVASVIQIRIRK